MPELTIVRKYIPELDRALPTGVEIDGEPQTFTQLIKHPRMIGVMPCRVEAGWVGEARPDTPVYVDDEFSLNTQTGVVIAASATVKPSSSIGPGTILHGNTTVAQSNIGPGSELERCAFVAAGARLGRGCLIGTGAVIQDRTLGDFTVIEHGKIILPTAQPPLDGREFGHLDMRADDPLR